MADHFELTDRSDQQLLTGAKRLAGQEREATAQLIAHLSEIDARRLYLSEGCASLFKYCTEVLHLSESAAGNRIIVARLARRFPVILERLAEGAIHLSALRILAPCLTPENHLALLEAARHKSKDDVERIAVTIRPHPDVPSVVRKLPEKVASKVAPASPRAEHGGTELFGGSSGTELFGGIGGDGLVEGVSGTAEATAGDPAGDPVAVAPIQTPFRRATVSPLRPARYKIEFTADAETHQALRQLQELLRHQVPSGDPGTIFKKALLLLLEGVRREKLAQVKRPRRRRAKMKDLWKASESGIDVMSDADGSSTEAPGAHRTRNGQNPSRHIPADVKRSVWERDKGRCTFVGKSGRRCTATGWLEFHHLHAYALGGPATLGNIALRCRAHNAHESRLLFTGSESRRLLTGNGKELTRPGACSNASAQTSKRRRP